MPFLSSRIASFLDLSNFLFSPNFGTAFVKALCSKLLFELEEMGINNGMTGVRNSITGLQAVGHNEKPSSRMKGDCQTGICWRARCYWF